MGKLGSSYKLEPAVDDNAESDETNNQTSTVAGITSGGFRFRLHKKISPSHSRALYESGTLLANKEAIQKAA